MEQMITSCPYKGLMPYEEQDAPFFFGRDREKRVIISNLYAARLTILYGTSGAGKSSVLRAGVVNELWQRAEVSALQEGEPNLAVAYFNEWQDNIVARLKKAIMDALLKTLPEAGRIPEAETIALSAFIKATTDRLNGDLMVIFDQFEEYFEYHARDEGPVSFAHQFAEAVNQVGLPVSFLLSIREDSLSKLDRFKRYIPNLFGNYLRLQHLDHEATRRAILGPIQEYNGRLPKEKRQEEEVIPDPGLADGVIDELSKAQEFNGVGGRGQVDSGAEPGIMTPYLQLVMTRLWNEEMKRSPRVLSVKTLKEDLGGAESIVKSHLDSVMGRLSEREQEAAASLFYHLVTPSGTKIAQKPSDLARYAHLTTEQVKPVLDRLTGQEMRVLKAIGPMGTGDEARYELFHDILAPAILNWRARYLEAQRFIRPEYRVLVVLATVVFGALLGGLYAAIARMVPGFYGLTLTQQMISAGSIPEKLFAGLFALYQGFVGGLIWGTTVGGLMALGWVVSRRYGRRLIGSWNVRDVLFGASGGLVGGIIIAAAIFITYLGTPSQLWSCFVEKKFCLIHPFFGVALGAGIAISIEAFYLFPHSSPGWDRFIEPHDKAGRIVQPMATLRQLFVFSVLYSIPAVLLLWGTAICLESRLKLKLVWAQTAGEVTSIIVGSMGVFAGIILGQLITRVGIPVPPQSDERGM